MLFVVESKDLVEKLEKAMIRQNVEWKRVPAHQGNFGNEMADRLAKKGALSD